LIAISICRVIGLVLAVILLAMIFNTAGPSLYTLTARFFTVDTRRFRVAAVVVGIVAFSLGFIGFADLVNTIYPLLGYVGFVIFAGMAVNLFRTKRAESKNDVKVFY